MDFGENVDRYVCFRPIPDIRAIARECRELEQADIHWGFFQYGCLVAQKSCCLINV